MKIKNISKWSSFIMIGFMILSCTDDHNIGPDQPIKTTDQMAILLESSSYKVKSGDPAWIASQSRILDPLCIPAIPATNAWGGRTDRVASVVKGTEGFFRLGKLGDRWVFVDPDNGANIIHGTQNVAPSTSSNFTNRFPSESEWAEETADLLKKTYINCIDNGAVRPDRMVIPENLRGALLNPEEGIKNAYNVQLSMLRSFVWDKSKSLSWSYDDSSNDHNRLNLIFEDEYKTYLESEVQRICDIFRDDVHLLGYQLDNELGFRGWDDRFGAHGILLNKFLSLPTQAKAQQYAEEFVSELGLNRNDVLAVSQTAHIEAKGLTEAFAEFRSRVAQKYYKMYYEAIKKYDTNHLILGSRIHSLGMYDKETLTACAQYCDVITINYYQAWTPDPDYMNNIRKWTNDTPFFITEFYVKGADANYDGTLYNNESGGGWVVPTQIERSHFYQNFCIGLLEAKNCIGWTYFAYNDVFTSTSEPNGNRGLVSAKYYPYPSFIDGVSRINRNIYVLADYFDGHKQ